MRDGAAVFTPQEMTQLTVKRLRTLSENRQRAVPFPVSGIDKYFAPTMPGQVTAVIAQTSHGKSFLIDSWANHLVTNVANHEGDEIVVKVDVETMIEETGLVEISRRTSQSVGDLAQGKVQDWDAITKAVIDINRVGVYRITGSIERAQEVDALPLSVIKSEIDYLRNKAVGRPVKIVAIFIDYLQALPIDPDVQRSDVKHHRRLQVRNDIYRIRQMAAYFDVPIIVGVQAKQTLQGAPSAQIQIPGIYDGEESSSIAQRCDRIVQLWMPKMTHNVGDRVTHKGITFKVTENMMWIKVGKQRGGLPSGRAWMCYANYDAGKVALAADSGVDE